MNRTFSYQVSRDCGRTFKTVTAGMTFEETVNQERRSLGNIDLMGAWRFRFVAE